MPQAAQRLAQRFPTALVTGASSGIGRAVAAALLREGVTVYGTSRKPDLADPIPGVRWIFFDGASREGINSFLEEQAELLNEVNLLVNNAGSSYFGSISQLTRTMLETQLTLLLEAPVLLTRAVLPRIQERGGGIVNISSLAAQLPMPHMSVYTAGKAGLSAFTRSLMLTEKKDGMTLIDFQPGDFRTAFNRNQAPSHRLNPGETAAWKQIEHHLEAAPSPEKAAEDLLKALRKGRSGTVRSGGFFQKHVAALGARLLPGNLLSWAIRHYYHLPSG